LPVFAVSAGFIFLTLFGNFTLGQGIYFIGFKGVDNIIIFFLFAQAGRKCNFSAGFLAVNNCM
jgi:hypothetical protein